MWTNKQEVREWKRKPDVDKTIDNFKAHFVESYNDMMEKMDGEKEAEQAIEEEANALTTDFIQAILNQEKQQSTSDNQKIGEALKFFLQKLNNLQSNNPQPTTNRNNLQPTTNRNNHRPQGKMSWRKDAPGEGEDTKKTFEGMEYKYCAKCRGGKGLWTKGEGKHNTEQHVPSKSSRN